MVGRKKQSIYYWKDRQDEHMKKLSLDMNGLQDALQSELINAFEVDRYIRCISSKFDLVRQDSEIIREFLANEDEKRAEFQRIDGVLREEVYQLRSKARRAVDEVKRKEEEETKRYYEMLKNQSTISKKTETNGIRAKVNEVFKTSKIEVLEEKVTPEESCDSLQVENIEESLVENCEKYETVQSTVKQIVDTDCDIVDRFSCTCDGCMFMDYDSPGIMELEKDCPDWTDTWLELCKSNIDDPWNISYDKIPNVKSILKIASNSKRKNCKEIKRSQPNVKFSTRSQERSQKTKQSKGLKVLKNVPKVKTEVRCKMPYETMKSYRKFKRKRLKDMIYKKVDDSVMLTKKVRSKLKRDKHRCIYTSDSKKETYKNLEKSVVVNRRKLKISLHNTKLLQFKYRRKKMAEAGYMSISGHFHVKSGLIKQYINKNMIRSVKKVKFKETNEYRCGKRCHKITVIKYWLKKPWKKKNDGPNQRNIKYDVLFKHIRSAEKNGFDVAYNHINTSVRTSNGGENCIKRNSIFKLVFRQGLNGGECEGFHTIVEFSFIC